MTDLVIRLGRWFWCKYCSRNIQPCIGADGSIVVCPRCDHGLAPVKEVIEAGSLRAWYERLEREWYERHFSRTEER